MFSGLAYLVSKDDRQWSKQQVAEMIGASLTAARLEGTASEKPLTDFLNEHLGKEATAVEKGKVVDVLGAIAWGYNA